jgi:hypothetical protein
MIHNRMHTMMINQAAFQICHINNLLRVKFLIVHVTGRPEIPQKMYNSQLMENYNSSSSKCNSRSIFIATVNCG